MSTAVAIPNDEGREQEIREELRTLVRDHTNYKRWETRFRNALKLKRDDEEQKRPTAYVLTAEYKGRIEGLLALSGTWTDEIEKKISRLVRELPIWREWAKPIKGVAEITIAYLEALVDLDKAMDNQGRVLISKVRRFAGYGPPEDKAAPGKRKYCAGLKTQLWQCAHSLMQTRNVCESKYGAIYDGIKNRYQNSERIVSERRKNNGSVQIPWKDARKGHHENATYRRMIQEVLKDYTKARAALEGREVRPPYEEEYLGRRHSE